MKSNNRLLVIGILAMAAAATQLLLPRNDTNGGGSVWPSNRTARSTASPGRTEASQATVEAIDEAYRKRSSNVQVASEGSVERLLSDDNDGSRHQRFLLRLASGRTLLVAHNIDLAPRIDALREGDKVRFYGEYEWNDKGGVLHWTHRDPAQRHPGGWLEHRGRRYE